MHKCLRFCLAFLLLVWPPLGHASSHLLQSARLEDPEGQLTLAQVQANADAFQPYEGILTRGYTPATYWLKLRIAPTPDPTLVLRIRPSFIDHIELHDPLALAAAQGQPRLSGDRHRQDLGGYLSLHHGFLIPGARDARDVYLRVQSTSSMMLHVQALTPFTASEADHRHELLYSLYLGLLAAFMAWALLQWLSSRELLVAVFLGKQTVVFLHALAVQGYLPLLVDEWLTPAAMDRSTSVLALAYVSTSAGFMLLLLREFKPMRWLWWSVTSLLLLYLPIFVLFFAGYAQAALRFNMYMTVIGSLGILLVALSTRVWHTEPGEAAPLLSRPVLISFNVALMVAALSWALPSLGGIDAAEWTLNSPVFGGFVNSLLMTVLLSLRARNLDKQRRQATLNARLLEQQAHIERQRREEQERFLAMLTHELKTPLGVARISLDHSQLVGPQRNRIDRALSNINAIIDRCAITDQMEHRQLVPQMAPCVLDKLVSDCVQGCSDPARVKVSESLDAAVQTDYDLLALCLANLIDNALKYSPPAAAIDVRLHRQADGTDEQRPGYAITVSNPVGSAGAPDPERLFTKYYRSPGALSKSGSGLGLYLTHSVAQLLGVRLDHRAQGEHLSFTLWIPA